MEGRLSWGHESKVDLLLWAIDLRREGLGQPVKLRIRETRVRILFTRDLVIS
jgi:hypothetical protein